jgi:STE24 endopeptidase
MESTILSWVFTGALLLSMGLKLWLSGRQIRHVAAHQNQVPPAFAGKIELSEHQKAARYSVAKSRFSILALAFGSACLVGWTLLGGLGAMNMYLAQTLQITWGDMAYQLALIGCFVLVSSMLDLPLDLYNTFWLEQKFGFNRTTAKLYCTDLLKSTVLGAVIGLPIAALILWIVAHTGALWWLWAWGAWIALNLTAMVVYPLFISPWFNRFEPLQDEEVKSRVRALMLRCGFTAQGFFVMDGSKRSGHSNAYFTGLGKAKRVVFFDTLLAKLSAAELQAVLAHELGHFHHRHLLLRMLSLFAFSLGGFALLGWVSAQHWFFMGLGAEPSMVVPNHALALLLFLLVTPVFGFFLTPIFSIQSRRHEFQADAYARAQTSGADLASALLKLYETNASTLTPDPWYARFYYSHPPATERIFELTR